MSRLIAQELAARERELVQLRPEDIKKAQQWIGTDNNANNANNVIKPDAAINANAKKSVSFSNTHVVEEEEEEEEEPTDFIKENDFEDTNSILSKFKPIQPIQPIQSQTQSITMQQLYNKIIELEQSMNAKHAEIMEYLHGLNVKGGEP